MFMRTFSAAALTLVLSACGSPGEQEEMADIDGNLYCAVDGANELTQICTMERIHGPACHVLVLHHLGGGFRRFARQSVVSRLMRAVRVESRRRRHVKTNTLT